MGRQQINVRLSDAFVAAIDEKRVNLRDALGGIPSRSDVVRMALETFLCVDSEGHPTTTEGGPEGNTRNEG